MIQLENIILVQGKIHFDPQDITNKHLNQASWKRMALVLLDAGDICDYYAWFLYRRYHIKLNKPLRGPHISFINDSERDLGEYGLSQWDIVKNKYDNTSIEIKLNVDPRANGEHWWLNVPNEYRTELHNIRTELGLGRPYFGCHMSLGYVHPLYLEHSTYILRLLEQGLIE